MGGRHADGEVAFVGQKHVTKAEVFPNQPLTMQTWLHCHLNMFVSLCFQVEIKAFLYLLYSKHKDR